MKVEQLLKEEAESIGVILTEDKLKLFEIYRYNLTEWNKVMNLTAIKEEKEIAIKHFLDSLTCVKHIREGNSIIDIGTGAGFPGIPIKIYFGESIKVTLVDSTMKKVKFLNDTKEKLSLEKVEIINGRAEELGAKREYREKYDVVLSRAVADLALLCEYCLPFLKVGGLFLSMKGGAPEEEVGRAARAIKVLGGELKEIEKVKIFDDKIEHSIIVIKKIKETPDEYPRNKARIDNNPIK